MSYVREIFIYLSPLTFVTLVPYGATVHSRGRAVFKGNSLLAPRIAELQISTCDARGETCKAESLGRTSRQHKAYIYKHR